MSETPESGTLVRTANHLERLPNGTAIYNYSEITAGERILLLKKDGMFYYMDPKNEVDKGKIPKELSKIGYPVGTVWLPAWVL